MYSVQCPLEPHAFAELMLPMRLDQVKKMEDHVSTGVCHHPPLREFICHGKIAGTTPLLLACQNGQLDSVKRIVQVWGVDVQASAVYYDESRIKINGATPLFVAAINGNVDIVRYLLEKGASFASKTDSTSLPFENGLDGLTPLHGALYGGDKSKMALIVRLLLEAGADPSALPSNPTPIWLMNQCNSEMATLLINYGLDLTQRDQEFATILHHWASVSEGQQSLSVVKLLIDKGADPLARDCAGFSPILTSAKFLNLSILDYLLKRDGVPLIEQIDALELAGAVILGDAKYASLRPKAFDFWRKALQLRQLANEESGPLNKTPLKFENVKTVEWVTADELEDVIQHPSKYLVQSFFLQLRIALSCETWSAVNRFLYPLSGEDSLLQQPDRFAHNLDILWASMETIRQDSSGRLSYRAQSTTEALVNLLTFIQRDHPLLLTVEVMKTSMKLISDLDDYCMTAIGSKITPNYMRTLLRLNELLARLPQMLEEKIKPGDHKGGTVKDVLTKLVQRDIRDEYGQTLLYIACQLISFLPIDARVDTIRLLVDCGADPNAVYRVDGNAPLHVLAKFNGEVVDAVANLLLEKGAHFDRPPTLWNSLPLAAKTSVTLGGFRSRVFNYLSDIAFS